MIEPYSHERPSATAAAGRAGLIELEEPMIFLASTGERMEIAPGPYHVGLGPDDTLALTSAIHQRTHHVQASLTWHELVLGEPRALRVMGPKGDGHVMMLLPGGAALQSSAMINPPPPPGGPPMVTAEMLAEALLQQSPSWAMLETDILDLVHSATIHPTQEATPFASKVTPPPTWMSCTVASCQPCPDGSVIYPPGMPINRLPLADYILSQTSVTVQSTFPMAGRLVHLVVTSVVLTRDPWKSWFPFMTWTDVYRQSPSSNGPLVFPSVIVATGRRTTLVAEVHKAFTSPTLKQGIPTVFELRVNGITLAKRTCGFFGRYSLTPEVRCL